MVGLKIKMWLIDTEVVRHLLRTRCLLIRNEGTESADSTLTLCWQYADITLTVRWYYADRTLTVRWHYADITLTLYNYISSRLNKNVQSKNRRTAKSSLNDLSWMDSGDDQSFELTQDTLTDNEGYAWPQVESTNSVLPRTWLGICDFTPRINWMHH